MNQKLMPPPYVMKADGDEITVICSAADISLGLGKLGFRMACDASSVWTYVCDSASKAEIFASLRDLNICFSRGREWSPAEIFETLAQQGELPGRFRSIVWTGLDEWLIREECEIV